MANIDSTLKGRLKTYGKFEDHAKIAQNLKAAMYDCPNWEELDSDMKEALEMVQHKIARILNGDPTYLDNWHDIIGYTRLVEKRLEDKQIDDHNEKVLRMEKLKDKTLFSEQQGV